MRGMKLAFVAVSLMAAMLWGCSSNRDSDGDETTTPGFGTNEEGIEFVGPATCIGCHEDISFSQDLVQDYLAGPHVIHSDHINAESDAFCLGCHDPIGAGRTLEELIDEADVPEEGLAAVTCENCHGAGGEHFGVGPVPNASPNYEVCGQCHEELPASHLPFHPEGDDIIGKFESSRHLTASIRNDNICVKCHTDEGGRLYKFVQTRESLQAHALALPFEASPVQCRTCHDPHNPNELLLPEIEDHGHVVASAEYATCINCHMSEQAELEADLETGELISTTLLYHEDRHMRVILDTHYDDPSTPGIVEGYVIDHHSERPCRTCHDVHAVQEIRADRDTNTINDQWAQSGHAGNILTIKKEVMDAYADMGLNRTPGQTLAMKQAGTDAEPFTHSPEINGWDNIEELGCQRCHTATGGMNFLKDPAAYEAAVAAFEVSGDPADAPNDFSYLEGWTPEEGSGQSELIYCWTCHANNAGGFNDPGEIPFPNGSLQSFDDGSNTCMACHQGRASGLTVAERIAAGNFGFVNRHYFAAAAILFGSETNAGFQYRDAAAYQGQNTYPGHGNTLSTCRSCHLREGEANHLFEPDIDRCTQCHEGIADFEDLGLPFGQANVDYDGDGTGESFQAEIDGMNARLLTAIQAYAADVLGAPIIYSSGSYPYWFKDTNGNGQVDGGEAIFPNRYTSFDATLLPAAYNFHANQDPCSDQHNYQYVLQTSYDSLDQLDDGAQNDSVAGATRP